MTVAEAYRVLDLPSSATAEEIQATSARKKQQLRLRLVPGLPASTRQKATESLQRVTTAETVLRQAASRPQRPGSARQRQSAAPPRPRRRAGSTPAAVPSWSDILNLFPKEFRRTLILVVIGYLLLGIGPCISSCIRLLAWAAPAATQPDAEDRGPAPALPNGGTESVDTQARETVFVGRPPRSATDPPVPRTRSRRH